MIREGELFRDREFIWHGELTSDRELTWYCSILQWLLGGWLGWFRNYCSPHTWSPYTHTHTHKGWFSTHHKPLTSWDVNFTTASCVYREQITQGLRLEWQWTHTHTHAQIHAYRHTRRHVRAHTQTHTHTHRRRESIKWLRMEIWGDLRPLIIFLWETIGQVWFPNSKIMK